MSIQDTKKAEDRIWLIKSSDSILGPYTTDELAQAVRTKSVGLLDEARTPFNRWLFVRDIPEIQTTISKLAQQEDTFEKTHSMAGQNLTITRNINDDTTPIPPLMPIKSSVSKVPPVVDSAYSAPISQPISEVSSETGGSPLKSYSMKPPAEPIPWGRWSMMAVAGISFLLALFSFIQRKSWESDQKKIWSEFQQLYVAQLYDDAYKKLKEYRREFPDQGAGLTRAGFLFLNPGRELVFARRMFEKSSQDDPNNKDLMVQNFNGLGLVSLYEGQFVQAKSYFDRALTLEPGNVLTRFNLISLYMSQGLWDEAYALTSYISRTDPKKSYLIQSTLSLLSNRYADKGKLLMQDLARSLDNSSYLRPIMRLIIMKLASQNNDFLMLEKQINEFLTDLPSLHMVFSENPIIDQRWRDWNFLYQFCSDLKGPQNLQAELLATQIVCVSQIQKWNEAEKIANEGMMRFPNNTKIRLAQVHLLTLMARWPDVRTIMHTANLTTDPALNWMFAKACLEENNKPCTELYLNPLLQQNPVSSAVYELQAQILCTSKISEGCRQAVTQGLLQDPMAYNLLKVKFQIEAGQL